MILLVEDNDDDAELTLRALRRNDVSTPVMRVVDGVEAIDYLGATGAYESRDRTDVPELILLDLKLPRLSGLDVLRWLESDDVNDRVPVVVLSSSIEEHDLASAYALSANSYVQKPIDFNEFVEAIGQIGSYWLALNRGSDEPLPNRMSRARR